MDAWIRVTAVCPAARGRMILAMMALGCFVAAGCDREDLNSGPTLTQQVPEEPEEPEEPENPDGPDCPQEAPIRAQINEVMVQNTSTIEDDTGSYVPWIEIYNPTDEEIILGGVFLSDDLTTPSKWTFPCTDETVLPPKGYLIVWCDGDESDPDDLHSNLTLESPFLQLALNGGTELVFFDVSFLEADTSFGRSPDGGSLTVLSEPTPGEPNPVPGGAPVEEPVVEFVRGDVDANLRLNILDVTAILKVLFNSATPPPCRDRLDTNDDGNVSLSDPLYLSNALFIRGPSIPEPFPEAGGDPTPDDLPCLPDDEE